MEREVKLIAIEDNNLILSFTDTEEQIRWPLNKINGRLEIGKNFTIKLESTQTTKNSIHTKTTQQNAENNNDIEIQRIKLLESLIN